MRSIRASGHDVALKRRSTEGAANIGAVRVSVRQVGSREWRFPYGFALTGAIQLVGAAQRFSSVWDSIRARLVLLALIASAPLLILAAVNASQDLTAARQDAQLEALRVAQFHADLIDEH